jgi:transcriptional regulator with XRE-family HTH domain
LGTFIVDFFALLVLIFAFMVKKHLVSPRLRSLRRERELSLDVVALHTGIDRGALSRKERRLVPVSETELLKLAAFFGVEPSELRNEEGGPAAQAALKPAVADTV